VTAPHRRWRLAAINRAAADVSRSLTPMTVRRSANNPTAGRPGQLRTTGEQALAAVVAAMGTRRSEGVRRAGRCALLRYEIGTPAVFGFAKRNSRALADNSEVMFSIVVNAALSDGVRFGTPPAHFALTFVAPPVSAGT
jgi:hypothetical protein